MMGNLSREAQMLLMYLVVSNIGSFYYFQLERKTHKSKAELVPLIAELRKYDYVGRSYTMYDDTYLLSGTIFYLEGLAHRVLTEKISNDPEFYKELLKDSRAEYTYMSWQNLPISIF